MDDIIIIHYLEYYKKEKEYILLMLME